MIKLLETRGNQTEILTRIVIMEREVREVDQAEEMEQEQELATVVVMVQETETGPEMVVVIR